MVDYVSPEILHDIPLLGKGRSICSNFGGSVCVFIPSNVRLCTIIMEVPGTLIGASFFESELKPTREDSSDHPIPQGFSCFLLKPYVKVVTQSVKLNGGEF